MAEPARAAVNPAAASDGSGSVSSAPAAASPSSKRNAKKKEKERAKRALAKATALANAGAGSADVLIASAAAAAQPPRAAAATDLLRYDAPWTAGDNAAALAAHSPLVAARLEAHLQALHGKAADLSRLVYGSPESDDLLPAGAAPVIAGAVRALSADQHEAVSSAVAAALSAPLVPVPSSAAASDAFLAAAAAPAAAPLDVSSGDLSAASNAASLPASSLPSSPSLLQLYPTLRPSDEEWARQLLHCAATGSLELFSRVNDLRATLPQKVLDDAFLVACENGHFKVVLLLCDYVSSLNCANTRGEDGLMLAARNGHIKVCLALMKNGAALDARSADGLTALFFAVEGTHEEIAEILLGQRCSVDVADAERNTLLHVAAANCSPELVKLILRFGASASALNARDETPLDVAKNADVCRVVLEYHIAPPAAEAKAADAVGSQGSQSLMALLPATPVDPSSIPSSSSSVAVLPAATNDEPSQASSAPSAHDLPLPSSSSSVAAAAAPARLSDAHDAAASASPSSALVPLAVPANSAVASQAPAPLSPVSASLTIPPPAVMAPAPPAAAAALALGSPGVCVSPFRELPPGPCSLLFWSALGVGKDSLMFQNVGVYPFDRLNDTERILVMTDVAEIMSGQRPAYMPPVLCNVLTESALYAVFAFMKARVKKELEEAEAEEAQQQHDIEALFTWRKRVLDAYEQVYHTSAAQAGLSVECWKRSVWMAVINLLARSLFGPALFTEKKRLFLSPNALQRPTLLSVAPTPSSPSAAQAQGDPLPPPTLPVGYFSYRLPVALSSEVQATFKRLLTMSRTVLAAAAEEQAAAVAAAQPAAPAAAANPPANGAAAIAAPTAASPANAAGATPASNLSAVVAAANSAPAPSRAGCFCQECIAELEVPLAFKLQFLEEAAEEKRKTSLAQQGAHGAPKKAKRKTKTQLRSEKERAKLLDDDAKRTQLDDVVRTARPSLRAFWSALAVEEKWTLTEMTTTELADNIAVQPHWETLRAALVSYAKYAWEEDVLEITEDCVTIADDMCEEKGMHDMLEAMLDAVELSAALADAFAVTFSGVAPASAAPSLPALPAPASAAAAAPAPAGALVPAGQYPARVVAAATALLQQPVWNLTEDEWDKRGRQLLENIVLAAFARKVAAAYLLKKEESRAQQVALELELQLLQEEEAEAASGSKSAANSATSRRAKKKRAKAKKKQLVGGKLDSLPLPSPASSPNPGASAKSSAASSPPSSVSSPSAASSGAAAIPAGVAGAASVAAVPPAVTDVAPAAVPAKDAARAAPAAPTASAAAAPVRAQAPPSIPAKEPDARPPPVASAWESRASGNAVAAVKSDRAASGCSAPTEQPTGRLRDGKVKQPDRPKAPPAPAQPAAVSAAAPVAAVDAKPSAAKSSSGDARPPATVASSRAAPAGPAATSTAGKPAGNKQSPKDERKPAAPSEPELLVGALVRAADGESGVAAEEREYMAALEEAAAADVQDARERRQARREQRRLGARPGHSDSVDSYDELLDGGGATKRPASAANVSGSESERENDSDSDEQSAKQRIKANNPFAMLQDEESPAKPAVGAANASATRGKPPLTAGRQPAAASGAGARSSTAATVPVQQPVASRASSAGGVRDGRSQKAVSLPNGVPKEGPLLPAPAALLPMPHPAGDGGIAPALLAQAGDGHGPHSGAGGAAGGASGAWWERLVDGMMFICTRETQRECMELGLLGLPRQHLRVLRTLRARQSALFLFNVADRHLYGVFQAVAPGSENVNASAWARHRGGRTPFPAQVAFEPVANFEPLPEAAFRHLFADGNRLRRLDAKQVRDLIQLFRTKSHPLPAPALPALLPAPAAAPAPPPGGAPVVQTAHTASAPGKAPALATATPVVRLSQANDRPPASAAAAVPVQQLSQGPRSAKEVAVPRSVPAPQPAPASVASAVPRAAVSAAVAPAAVPAPAATGSSASRSYLRAAAPGAPAGAAAASAGDGGRASLGGKLLSGAGSRGPAPSAATAGPLIVELAQAGAPVAAAPSNGPAAAVPHASRRGSSGGSALPPLLPLPSLHQPAEQQQLARLQEALAKSAVDAAREGLGDEPILQTPPKLRQQAQQARQQRAAGAASAANQSSVAALHMHAYHPQSTPQHAHAALAMASANNRSMPAPIRVDDGVAAHSVAGGGGAHLDGAAAAGGLTPSGWLPGAGALSRAASDQSQVSVMSQPAEQEPLLPLANAPAFLAHAPHAHPVPAQRASHGPAAHQQQLHSVSVGTDGDGLDGLNISMSEAPAVVLAAANVAASPTSPGLGFPEYEQQEYHLPRSLSLDSQSPPLSNQSRGSQTLDSRTPLALQPRMLSFGAATPGQSHSGVSMLAADAGEALPLAGVDPALANRSNSFAITAAALRSRAAPPAGRPASVGPALRAASADGNKNLSLFLSLDGGSMWQSASAAGSSISNAGATVAHEPQPSPVDAGDANAALYGHAGAPAPSAFGRAPAQPPLPHQPKLAHAFPQAAPQHYSSAQQAALHSLQQPAAPRPLAAAGQPMAPVPGYGGRMQAFVDSSSAAGARLPAGWNGGELQGGLFPEQVGPSPPPSASPTSLQTDGGGEGFAEDALPPHGMHPGMGMAMGMPGQHPSQAPPHMLYAKHGPQPLQQHQHQHQHQHLGSGHGGEHGPLMPGQLAPHPHMQHMLAQQHLHAQARAHASMHARGVPQQPLLPMGVPGGSGASPLDFLEEGGEGEIGGDGTDYYAEAEAYAPPEAQGMQMARPQLHARGSSQASGHGFVPSHMGAQQLHQPHPQRMQHELAREPPLHELSYGAPPAAGWMGAGQAPPPHQVGYMPAPHGQAMQPQSQHLMHQHQQLAAYAHPPSGGHLMAGRGPLQPAYASGASASQPLQLQAPTAQRAQHLSHLQAAPVAQLPPQASYAAAQASVASSAAVSNGGGGGGGGGSAASGGNASEYGSNFLTGGIWGAGGLFPSKPPTPVPGTNGQEGSLTASGRPQSQPPQQLAPTRSAGGASYMAMPSQVAQQYSQAQLAPQASVASGASRQPSHYHAQAAAGPPPGLLPLRASSALAAPPASQAQAQAAAPTALAQLPLSARALAQAPQAAYLPYGQAAPLSQPSAGAPRPW